MKKLLPFFIICYVLFLGCDIFIPPDIHEGTPSASADSADMERKDALALKHLTVPNVSEDVLASYVMSFINSTTSSETGTSRSIQPSPSVVITNTTRLTHEVETGFAETTADNRSARSVIGSAQIPFYVFTLEDQQTGKTGFALTCVDNRIGNVLAVVEEGDYDDDNPFFHIFYSQLDAYIEETIRIYNSITDADIENALDKRNAARSIAPYLPVTDVGKNPGFVRDYNFEKNILIPAIWDQGSPYNKIVMAERPLPKVYEEYYYYVTGCGPVAIAIIMAFHEVPKGNSRAPKYTGIEYDWKKMKDGNDDNAIGVLMYEIGLPENASSTYNIGLTGTADPAKTGKKDASTGTSNSNVIRCFMNMGYKKPESFKTYNFSGVKSSIDDEKPVMVSGYAIREERKYIFGISSFSYKSGHYWVIDGYRKMKTKYKEKIYGVDLIDTEYIYVHCNMGWGGTSNGWYINELFDARYINIPWPDQDGDKEIVENRSVDGYEYFYQYKVLMLINITPK